MGMLDDIKATMEDLYQTGIKNLGGVVATNTGNTLANEQTQQVPQIGTQPTPDTVSNGLIERLKQGAQMPMVVIVIVLIGIVWLATRKK